MSGFYRLKNLGHGLAAENGVLKAADMATLDEAQGLISEAKAQADALRARAEEHYRLEKERGYREGREELDRQRAGQMIEDQHRLDAKLADLERELGRVVYDSVRQIIEGFEDEELATQVARSALSSMRTERRGQLFVSTAHYPIAMEKMPELVESFPEVETIDVIEDSELEPPNVRLESKLGVVAFVLDDTLEALKRLLEKH